MDNPLDVSWERLELLYLSPKCRKAFRESAWYNEKRCQWLRYLDLSRNTFLNPFTSESRRQLNEVAWAAVSNSRRQAIETRARGFDVERQTSSLVGEQWPRIEDALGLVMEDTGLNNSERYFKERAWWLDSITTDFKIYPTDDARVHRMILTRAWKAASQSVQLSVIQKLKLQSDRHTNDKGEVGRGLRTE